MQEIFIASIMIFDVSTGQPLGIATAAFESEKACMQAVAETTIRAQDDLRIRVEGGCTATVVIPAN